MKAEVTRDDDAGIYFEIKDDGSAEYQKAWNIVKDANAREQKSREAMRERAVDVSDKSMTCGDAVLAGYGIPAAGTISQGRRESSEDIPRLRSLPLMEQLADRGDAMKIVPIFAIEMIQEAAEYIDGLLVENADLRAAIKHLGHNPVTRDSLDDEG